LPVTNEAFDVFVRDRSTGVTERVSVSSTGEQAGPASFEPAISADGRYIAFWSSAPNLVSGDTNGSADVFVRDRLTGSTDLVSVSSAELQGNGSSGDGLAISPDGRFVAFMSSAKNLVPNDTNECRDIFLRDRLGGTTELVSVSSTAQQGNDCSDRPAVSADGCEVDFESAATNLVPGDTNNRRDIFVRHRCP
jgi:Tol biopolymer transport system component